MLCPQLLMTEHGREQAATTGRGMAAGGAWSGCALIWAKQISAMVVGHCFLREGLCLGIVREVLKFQYLKVLITRVPPPVIADGSGYALCGKD